MDEQGPGCVSKGEEGLASCSGRAPQRRGDSSCVVQWESCRPPRAEVQGDSWYPQKIAGFHLPPQEMDFKAFPKDTGPTRGQGPRPSAFGSARNCTYNLEGTTRARRESQCQTPEFHVWLLTCTLGGKLQCLPFNLGRFGFSVSR